MVQLLRILRLSPNRFANVIRIFALPLIVAAMHTASVLVYDWGLEKHPLFAILLGVSAATLWVESHPRYAGRDVPRVVIGLLAIAISWGMFEVGQSIQRGTGGVYFVLGLAMYVLPALVPGKTTRDFAAWLYQISYAQIMAFVGAWLFIGGTVLAIGSIKEIFGLDFKPKIFGDVMTIGTQFGFPLLGFILLPNLLTLTEEMRIPRAQRIITGYVLLPLAWLLIVLCYLYAGKALVLWRPLTDSMVLNTMMAIVIAGPFLHALLSCHPELGNRAERAFHRWFFLLAWVPLITVGIYFVRTILVHGLTTPRYWGVVALVWAAGTALYYLLAGATRYKLQYAALVSFALILFGSYSPWRDEVLVKQSRSASAQKISAATTEYRTIMLDNSGKVLLIGENHVLLELYSLHPGKTVLDEVDATAFKDLVLQINGADIVLMQHDQPLLTFNIQSLVDKVTAPGEELLPGHQNETREAMTFTATGKGWKGTLAIKFLQVQFHKGERRMTSANASLLLEHIP